MTKPEFKLEAGRTGIMGILNVTPDSFSDGGLFLSPDTAVRQGVLMYENGADIIDIGGESSRPGAEPIHLQEELDRVLPVVEALAAEGIPTSIDTYKSRVAGEALKAGAVMVNDISGLRFDPRLGEIAAEYSAWLVLMHIKGKPRNMQKDTHYDDLIGEISQYLFSSAERAVQAGVEKDKIILDPGIGFGKSFSQNLEIIRNLSEFKKLGYPVLVGPSRKAFIGSILDKKPHERLYGTCAACALAAVYGADMVRVHDVAEIAQVMKMTDFVIGKRDFDEAVRT